MQQIFAWLKGQMSLAEAAKLSSSGVCCAECVLSDLSCVHKISLMGNVQFQMNKYNGSSNCTCNRHKKEIRMND